MTPKSAGGRKGRTQRGGKRNEEREITERTRGNNAGTTVGQQRLRVIYLIFPYSAASPLCGTPGSSFPFLSPSREFMGKVTGSMMRR